MKKIGIGIMLIFWIIGTLLLVASIIGLILLSHDDLNRKSTWMQIGYDLTQELIK